MMQPILCNIGFSPQPSRMAFTFIALTGYDHAETRAHVRLLGRHYKTDRMKAYARQHLRRVRVRKAGSYVKNRIQTVLKFSIY